MYVLTARLTAKRGKWLEASDYLCRTRDIAAKVVGKPVYAWNVATGAPVGTFVMTSRAESMAEYLADTRRLRADPAYQRLMGDGDQCLEGPIEVQVDSVIATTTMDAEPKPYLSAVTATIASERTAEALAWGTDMLEHASKLVGAGGVFTMAAAGRVNVSSWWLTLETAEDVDEAYEILRSDPDYATELQRAMSFFVEGSAQRSLLVMLA